MSTDIQILRQRFDHRVTFISVANEIPILSAAPSDGIVRTENHGPIVKGVMFEKERAKAGPF